MLKFVLIPPMRRPLKVLEGSGWFVPSCRLMPAVLRTLTDRKDLLTNELHLLSAVTALQRVTETLPHFISPYLQDIVSQVATRCLSCSNKPLNTVDQLLQRCGLRFQPQLLFYCLQLLSAGRM